MAKQPSTIEFQFRNKRFKDASQGLRFFSATLNADFKKTGPVLKRELREYLDAVAEALAKRHGNPWPLGTQKDSLASRSGKGLRSIQRSIKVVGRKIENIEGRIGARFQMAFHEKGGVIRAKRVQYLTIPLPAALKTDGTPIKRRARNWKNTFVARSRQGNLLIFQKRGGGIVPLYLLKKEVFIPPRLNMEKTLMAGLPFFVDKAVDAMAKELRGG